MLVSAVVGPGAGHPRTTRNRTDSASIMTSVGRRLREASTTDENIRIRRGRHRPDDAPLVAPVDRRVVRILDLVFVRKEVDDSPLMRLPGNSAPVVNRTHLIEIVGHFVNTFVHRLWLSRRA
jgi:hypothetical protein